MRRLLIITIAVLVVLPLRAMITWEEVTWIYEWRREWVELYMQEKLSVEHFSQCNLPIPMPVLKENHRASAQLDSLIEKAMKEGRSLEWAVDSLKPASAPAASLSDSLRRKIIYYLYRDRLGLLEPMAGDLQRLKGLDSVALSEPPWRFTFGGHYSWLIHGGAETAEQGWIRYADLKFHPAPPEVELDGFIIISWARGEGGTMNSVRAMRIFADAVGQGMFVSRSIDSVLRILPRTFPDVPAVCMDVVFEVEKDFWCSDDTFRVFTFEKGGYEYIFSYSS